LLTVKRILELADAYHEKTGEWPTRKSSWLPGDTELTWRRIDNALLYRLRGLSVRSSLAQLLARERGVRNVHDLPELTEELILSWADRHHERTGRWPTENSGPVADAPGEVWQNVNAALMQGHRGFPGGSSLAVLLATRRGVRNLARLPRLTLRDIRRWARAHRERSGKWPTAASGPIPEAPGENWHAVNLALWQGLRGLPGGSSLAKLLKRGRRESG
jgi:hypothetical protein